MGLLSLKGHQILRVLISTSNFQFSMNGLCQCNYLILHIRLRGALFGYLIHQIMIDY
jgi:hypothetical protein